MPAFGVYSVSVKGIENKIYNGIANIGRRPTVNDRGVLLEVNIFDFNNNIFGKEISVNLLNFIRKEKKFDGIESLKTQIKNDVRVSKEFCEACNLSLLYATACESSHSDSIRAVSYKHLTQPTNYSV